MKRRLLMLAVAALYMVLPFVPAGQAEAVPFARANWRGYFTNALDTNGSFVLLGGVFPTAAPLSPTGQPYVESFLTRIKTSLNGAGRNRTGAEFLILTMMGYPVGTAKATAHNAAVVADWENRVRTYSNNGWVNWNGSSPFTTNTYWQGNNGGGGEPDDVAWYNDVGSTPTIIFHEPATANFYIIKKDCANPLGDLALLAPADFNMSLTADSNGSPSSVVPGQTYSIRAALTNNGPANSFPGTLQVMIPGAGVSLPCVPNCNPASQNALVAYGGTKGFRVSSSITGAVGVNWFWSVGTMTSGAGTSGSLQFTVAPGATPGSLIIFDVYYSPANLGGSVRHTTVQYRVVSERIPAAVGYNADVHAGGGICKQALSSGSVKGFPGAGSMGEYVVSASAATGINSFKSNGTGADSLRVGQNGAYAQVCRPDLLVAAQEYYAGTGYSTIGSAVFDVTGKSGVYFYNAGDLRILGVVNNKLTVVVLNGKAVIDGPITIDNALHSARNAPSLGIIASGNIEIRAAVTRVDAYLFANGMIDTCPEANLSCATAVLEINGFLMARDIAFHRIGPLATSGPVVTEKVTLTPQIYLNPPRLFDASVDNVLLEGQGERQPLF